MRIETYGSAIENVDIKIYIGFLEVFMSWELSLVVFQKSNLDYSI
jgi:hypothetical protein